MMDGAFLTILEQIHSESGISGIAVAVARRQEPPVTFTVGKDQQGTDLSKDSLFPVASITKLATALAILRLGDQGCLSIEDPLGIYIPEAAAAQPGVTLKRLLTHSAGLPDLPESTWIWDEEHLSWPIFAQSCLKVRPAQSPGSKVYYDDTGYGLLGLLIERVAGLPLSQAMPELVFRPLGIEAYQGLEPPRQTVLIKDPGDARAGTPLELWNTPFWRTRGEPWGGLVTTPAGTLALLRAFLGFPKDFLRPETASAGIQDQTGGLGGGFPWQEFPHCSWGLGPMIFTEKMGHWLYPDAPGGLIGHGGYSGCTVFAYPSCDLVWAIHGTVTCADPWWQKAFTEINAAVLGAVLQDHQM